ncbi:MAG: PAS domain-containing protein [Methylotenera sp.]|nr:PAS domain-containing protein [Methylotenera sp.]
MTVHLHLFGSDRLRLKAGVTALVWLALSLCGNAWAASAIETWRNEAAAVRVLAENNAPAAYREAEHLQATLPADATHADQARLLNLLSHIEVYLALTDHAAIHAQQAFALSKQHADRIGQAEADLNIALNAVNQGRIDTMTAAVTDSMVILDGVDRPDLLSESMLRTAMMYRRQGQLDDSITMAMQAMEIAQHSNDPVALTYAHQGMAISFDQSGHLKEAREHYTQMREHAQAAHMQHLEAESIIGVGRLTSRLGDVIGGERLIREAIEIHRKIGSPFRVAFGLFALAENLHAQDRTTASLPVLDEVVAIYEKYPNPIGLWWTLNARSTHKQSLGHTDAARVDAERAYAVAKSIGFPLYLSESAKRMAAVAAGRGDQRRAYELFTEADAMSAQAAQVNASTRMLALAKRYESESKQRQIDALKLRSERQIVELQKGVLQQRWLWTMLGGGIIILVGTTIFLLHLRRSHRRLKNAHAQLQHFQNNQQAILDAIPDLLFELGLDGRYYDCHTFHSDLLVAPVESLLGKTVSDVMPPDAAEVCLSALREAHENGTSTDKQYGIQLPQGMCWFELSIARKAVAWGEAPRFIGIARDITEHKRLEAALYAREREFRTLAENSPDNIVRYDLQCRMRYVNPQFEKTVGQPAQGLLGKTPHGARSRLDVNYDDYHAKIEAVLGTGQDNEIELTLSDIGEGARYHHVRFVAERELNGDIVGVLAIGRDITQKRRVERLLLNLSNSIPGVLGAYRQRPDGSSHQVFASPGFYDVFGVTFEEIKDDSTPRLQRINPDDLIASLAIMDEAVRAMMPAWTEYRVNHPVKGEIWVETYATPVREDDGSIIWYGYSAEVTERHQLQDALKERERQLRTLVENLPDFVVRLDKHTRYLYVSPALTEAYSLSRDHFIGKTIVEAGLTGDMVSDIVLMNVALSCAREGIPIIREMVFRHPSGDRVFDIMYVPEHDEFGHIETVLMVARDITSLRTAHNELQKKEVLLRSLIDSIPDLIFFKSTDSVYLGFNKAFAEFCGHHESELVGKTDYDFAAVDIADTFREKDREMLASAITQHNDEWVTFPDGRVALLNTMKTPLLDAGGKIIGVIGVSRDITERYRMEQELIKREREFRTLAESAPDNIARYDREARMLYINPVLERTMGLLTAEVFGKRKNEIFPQIESMLRYQQILEQVIASGKPAEFEMISNSVGGERVLYDLIRFAPEFDAHGNVVGAVAIGRDYTEQKRLELELMRREREFRTLAENSPEMIVRYDCDYRCVYVNPAYVRHTGISSSSVDSIWRPMLPREEYIAWLKRVMQTGASDHILLEWRAPGGHLVSHWMHAVAEYDEDNHVVGVLAIGHNVSKLKETERQLEESQYLLRKLAARGEAVREGERKELAREVHDELGQYLMGLRINVTAVDLQFAKDNPTLHEKTKHLIALVDSTIQVVRNVVASLRPKALDMGIVSALEWLVDEYQERTKIICNLHVCNEGVQLDDKRVTAVFRIVQESLTNISRHAEASQVDIVLEKNESQYVLQVRDNGKGFDPEIRKDKSFGLVGMQERAYTLSGKVEVSSELGRGTIITVYIPVNDIWSEDDEWFEY